MYDVFGSKGLGHELRRTKEHFSKCLKYGVMLT